MERELKGIENEYKMYQSDEGRALGQIIASHVAIPGSPINRFTSGNLETLGRPNILETLKTYFEENHSSNIMSLVLVG